MKQSDDKKTLELKFPGFGRPRKYASNADRQMAYRRRLKAKRLKAKAWLREAKGVS